MTREQIETLQTALTLWQGYCQARLSGPEHKDYWTEELEKVNACRDHLLKLWRET